MVLQRDTTNPTSGEVWAERSAYWLRKYKSFLPQRLRREREPSPLILTGHGLSMRVKRDQLVVRDGRTHFPSEAIEYRYFKGGLERPKRIIVLDGYGTITLDALDWLAEQDIPLIRVKWTGEFLSLVTSGGLAADPEKFAWQLKARKDLGEKLAFYTPLVKDKLSNALATLSDYLPASDARDKAMLKIQAYQKRLQSDPPDAMKTLLGIEAQVASFYFKAWRDLELKWRENKRHPIPDEWRRFYSRGSLVVAIRGGANVFATHPVNALLNYAYTMLVNKMQLHAIAEGYDPMYGIIHTRDRSVFGQRRPSFALDIMEPMRPVGAGARGPVEPVGS